MKQKILIFLFIATFCIALMKSNDYDDGYPGDFPGAVLLSKADSLWGDGYFQECYSKENENHRGAIEKFYEQILEASNVIKEELDTEYKFDTPAPDIPASAKALADLLKEYQGKFLSLVNEGKYSEIQNIIKDYENRIGDSEMALDTDILTLKGMTTDKEKLNEIVKNFEKTRDTKLTNLTKACETVMESLTQCIEGKKL